MTLALKEKRIDVQSRAKQIETKRTVVNTVVVQPWGYRNVR